MIKVVVEQEGKQFTYTAESYSIDGRFVNFVDIKGYTRHVPIERVVEVIE